ncbi:hypothetical protein ACKVWC_007252 [Pyricularia oryzae]
MGSKSPKEFWRVEDERSRGRTDSTSFTAPYRDGKEALNNRILLEKHLKWANREPTPYISVYDNWDAANNEVGRRLNRGRMDVSMSRIDVSKVPAGKLQYRSVRRLCDRLGVEIEDKAWFNSKHEWIFLNEIPANVVVEECSYYELR